MLIRNGTLRMAQDGAGGGGEPIADPNPATQVQDGADRRRFMAAVKEEAQRTAKAAFTDLLDDLGMRSVDDLRRTLRTQASALEKVQALEAQIASASTRQPEPVQPVKDPVPVKPDPTPAQPDPAKPKTYTEDDVAAVRAQYENRMAAMKAGVDPRFADWAIQQAEAKRAALPEAEREAFTLDGAFTAMKAEVPQVFGSAPAPVIDTGTTTGDPGTGTPAAAPSTGTRTTPAATVETRGAKDFMEASHEEVSARIAQLTRAR